MLKRKANRQQLCSRWLCWRQDRGRNLPPTLQWSKMPRGIRRGYLSKCTDCCYLFDDILTLYSNWSSAFGVTGQQLSMHSPSHQDGLGVNTLGGARNSSPNSYVPATIGIDDSFVSPGMWLDSVAAAVYSDPIGKRNFPFDGEDNGWNTPLPPHRGPVTQAPTSAIPSS